jgi:phosphoglycolate phosphatase-like HAD superfamily hydrolase
VRIDVVCDLDGTLVLQYLSRELNEKTFYRTISQLKEEGFNVPIQTYSYQNLRCLLAASPKFNRYFRENYRSELEKHKQEIKIEGRIAQRIIDEVNSKIGDPSTQVQTIVLTANPMAHELIKAMDLKVYEVIIVDGSSDYVGEKAKILRKLRSNGEVEVYYVADTPEDEKAAKLAEANYIDVCEILREMLRDLFTT